MSHGDHRVLVQDPAHIIRWECLIQARPVGGVQVVPRQADLRLPREMPIHQLSHATNMVLPGAPLGHRDLTPAPRRLTPQGSVAAVDALPCLLWP
jgi:hypothetical protein